MRSALSSVLPKEVELQAYCSGPQMGLPVSWDLGRNSSQVYMEHIKHIFRQCNTITRATCAVPTCMASMQQDRGGYPPVTSHLSLVITSALS
ncbi:predicted protein [Plenodomus lingam JN3]|uniref:Predicted protein n=1 Tax=Leptosphaeria maculans (strain JN3 / isolate v23.1.3 / race Av1-4-5-6-7-8) TaxID=985895 RepID=E4ZJA8_LEPMJ|nr:predicted protein [Plenodomus lingam JN3]CBX91539.1 predicted protein [Plenodomus lingam JN3]